MQEEFVKENIGDVAVVTIMVPNATLKYASKFKGFMMRLMAHEEKKLIINFERVSYMDSTFLGSLVFTLKKMAAYGGEMKLRLNNVDTPIWTMFETTRMFRVFKTFQDMDTALKSFE